MAFGEQFGGAKGLDATRNGRDRCRKRSHARDQQGEGIDCFTKQLAWPAGGNKTENTSMDEAVDKALAANVEVVEAEQTAVKAKAGSALSKMQYFPSVAIVGGYTNQNALKIILPSDFSYIGVIATYTVFDFGKRERGVKESDAQAEMAEMAVPLTKAKVSAEVKSSYFELERSRKLSQLARRMVSSTQVVEASVQSDNSEVESAQAKMEADMFRAELEYRQAYSRLKNLMGGK
jgi:outer membrane protein TolC